MSEPLIAANCCATPPIAMIPGSEYVPKGRFEDHAELGFKIYRTGPEKSKVVLVHVYDIWGFAKSNNNYAQGADTIAANTGFTVIIPDVFHGAVFTPEIRAAGKLMEWVKEHGDWETNVKGDLVKTVEWCKKNIRAEKFGIYGFCYGGLIVTKSLSELSPPFLAGATFHPSFLTVDLADHVKAPLCLLPSKDEAEVVSTDFLKTLQSKSFGSQVVHRRFSDMHHGWAGTGGDFTNPVNKKRAEEAFTMSVKFFKREFGSGEAAAAAAL